jgi:hypothetical protein
MTGSALSPYFSVLRPEMKLTLGAFEAEFNVLLAVAAKDECLECLPWLPPQSPGLPVKLTGRPVHLRFAPHLGSF